MKVARRIECAKSPYGDVMRFARAASALGSPTELPGPSLTTAHPRQASRVGGLLFQTSQNQQIDIIYTLADRGIRKGGRRSGRSAWPIFPFNAILFGCRPARLQIINSETSVPAPNLQIQEVAAAGHNE
jgi:hypothetical protein